MRLTDLYEANIQVAHIDREARVEISKAFDRYVIEQLNLFIERDGGLKGFEEYSEERSEKLHELYDRFYEFLRDESQDARNFITVAKNQPGSAFGKVVRQNTKNNTLVLVKIKEWTDDKKKDNSGGYFTHNSNINQYMIVVFVELQKVKDSILTVVERELFGESINNHVDISDVLIPVLLHEYTHLMQELRHPYVRSDRDSGVITKGGKRGGRRSPSNGGLDQARYYGSHYEIEAFASGAAAEIIQELNKYSRYENTVSNDRIDDALRGIANGYADSRSVSHMRYMKDYWEDFEALGIDPKERDAAWNRFLKFLYKKIWQYRKEVMGKTPSWIAMDDIPKDWIEMAKKGIAQCASYIANQVAFELEVEANIFGSSPERLAASDPLANKALRFMDIYFTGDVDYETSLKVRSAMERLIASAIRNIAAMNGRSLAA